jgi:hypothetical protein
MPQDKFAGPWKYVGPWDEVEVNGLGLVKQGQVVDVQDEDVAAGLNGQDTWERQKPAKKTAATADASTDSQEG